MYTCVQEYVNVIQKILYVKHSVNPIILNTEEGKVEKFKNFKYLGKIIQSMAWKGRNKDEEPKDGAGIPTNKWSVQQNVELRYCNSVLKLG